MNTDDPGSAHNEISVAVNPSDPTNIVGAANDYRPNGGIGIYSSRDSGANWSNSILQVSKTTNSFSDPVLRFNRDGSSLYASELAQSVSGTTGGCDPNSGIYFHRSGDAGGTWAAATSIASNSPTTFNDKPWLTDDRSIGVADRSGNIYLSYTQFLFANVTDCTSGVSNDSPIRLRRSKDGGLTWGPETDVSGPYTNDQGSAIATAPDGEVFVAFNSSCGASSTDCIIVAKSTNGGDAFTQTHVADITFTSDISAGPSNFFRADSFPSIASDSAGHIYVVWSEVRAGTNSVEVYLSKTTDGGASWSAPARVNRVAANDHFFPFVTVDSNDVVWVSYSDRRDDPNNVKYKQHLSVSHDGASTWSDLPVSSVQSDPLAMQFSGNQFFIGDYNAMDVIPHGAGVWLGWCDSRNSRSSTPGQGQQDAFIGRVDAQGIESNLSLAVSPGDARIWGTTFRLTGALHTSIGDLPGKTIQIQWRVPGSELWKNLGNPVTTAADGSYSVGLDNDSGHFKPSKNTSVRAVFWGGNGISAALSPASEIKIRVGITLNVQNSTLQAGKTAIIFGSVGPAHPNKKVLIQLLSNKGWTAVGTVVLDSQSRFRWSVTLAGKGYRTYRVVFATQDSDHVWNISRTVGVHWT